MTYQSVQSTNLYERGKLQPRSILAENDSFWHISSPSSNHHAHPETFHPISVIEINYHLNDSFNQISTFQHRYISIMMERRWRRTSSIFLQSKIAHIKLLRMGRYDSEAPYLRRHWRRHSYGLHDSQPFITEIHSVPSKGNFRSLFRWGHNGTKQVGGNDTEPLHRLSWTVDPTTKQVD